MNKDIPTTLITGGILAIAAPIYLLAGFGLTLAASCAKLLYESATVVAAPPKQPSWEEKYRAEVLAKQDLQYKLNKKEKG